VRCLHLFFEVVGNPKLQAVGTTYTTQSHYGLSSIKFTAYL
jgi:hypothetical protein